jgi:hypothetical protein
VNDLCRPRAGLIAKDGPYLHRPGIDVRQPVRGLYDGIYNTICVQPNREALFEAAPLNGDLLPVETADERIGLDRGNLGTGLGLRIQEKGTDNPEQESPHQDFPISET